MARRLDGGTEVKDGDAQVSWGATRSLHLSGSTTRAWEGKAPRVSGAWGKKQNPAQRLSREEREWLKMSRCRATQPAPGRLTSAELTLRGWSNFMPTWGPQ